MATPMLIDEAAIAAAPGRPLGAISTLVSLFLLLLVFFVLLFSIAQVHRQRTDEVLASVDTAFGGLPSRLGLIPRPVPLTPAEDFVRSVSLLITGFALVSPQNQAGATVGLLRIELPDELLFRSGTDILTDRAKDMLPKLAVLLQSRPNPSQRFRMTFRMTVEDTAAQTQTLRLDQAARLAAALFEAGCPPDALQVGLRSGASADAVMEFALIGAPPEAE